MKIVEPKYEIITDISEGGAGLLQERGQDCSRWLIGEETGGISGKAGS